MGFLSCCMSDEERRRMTEVVWIDISIGKSPTALPVGRVSIGLFGNLVPKTVKNFIKLSEEKEVGKGYRGTIFHRIEKGLLIQGGDTEGTGGRGGRSIYGETFKDENFKLKHSQPGMVSMANRGKKDTNGSQFFITLKQLPVFDNQHVVFGQIIEGMEIIHQIENVETYGNSPTVDVTITDCGLKNIRI